MYILGHIITAGGLKTSPDKFKAINDMSLPINIEGVQQSNGFVNYKFSSQIERGY